MLGGLIGGGINTAMQYGLMKAQTKFQREMSKTQYQRAVKDMRKAGLNPILAAKVGGNAAPPGASGKAGDVGDPIATALEYKRRKAEIGLLKEQRDQVGQARITDANRANYLSRQAHKTWVEEQLLRAEIPSAKALETLYKTRYGEILKQGGAVLRTLKGGR